MAGKTDSPIGVFDSGVGGLTVARSIIDQLPDEDIIYVGDTAHGPYGPLTIPQVRAHALAIADDLVDRGVKAGDVIKVGKTVELECMDTPGHTMCHICLRSHTDQPALFSGDTLFNAGAGNCHNGGNPEDLYATFAEQLDRLLVTKHLDGSRVNEQNPPIGIDTIDPLPGRLQDQIILVMHPLAFCVAGRQ